MLDIILYEQMLIQYSHSHQSVNQCDITFKCVSKFILWLFIHVLNVSSSSASRHTLKRWVSTCTQSQRIMASSRSASRRSVVWQTAGGGVTFSPSVPVHSSSFCCMYVYMSLCCVQCNACKSICKETLNTGCLHFIQATSQLHLIIDLHKPCCWGKNWAQLSVPAWSPAYTYGVLVAFLSLFKELHLIYVMSVFVCVNQGLHQNKQSSSGFKSWVDPWLCPDPVVDLLYLQKVSTAFSTYAWKHSS